MMSVCHRGKRNDNKQCRFFSYRLRDVVEGLYYLLYVAVVAGTGQVWQAKSQREKEAELLYVGEEFRKAIMSYYNTGTKQYPESLEDLLQDKRTPAIKRHLRKIYTDPVMNTTEWGIVEEPPAGSNAAAKKNAAPGNSPAPNPLR